MINMVNQSSKEPIRIHTGELNVMELLWANGELTAKDIANVLYEYTGWKKNTTYTVIKRLTDKGAIKRKDPGFICIPMISKEEVRQIETDALINQLYDGKLKTFISDFISKQNLTNADLLEMKKIVDYYMM